MKKAIVLTITVLIVLTAVGMARPVRTPKEINTVVMELEKQIADLTAEVEVLKAGSPSSGSIAPDYTDYYQVNLEYQYVQHFTTHVYRNYAPYLTDGLGDWTEMSLDEKFAVWETFRTSPLMIDSHRERTEQSLERILVLEDFES